jgi:hypothetical protein
VRHLDPNETGKIKVMFNTSGRNGKQKKTIYVNTNDPENPLIKLVMLATIIEELTLNPRRVNFGKMKKEEKRSQKVQIKNTSGKTIQIISIEPSAYQIDFDFVNHTTEGLIVLKPDETLDILVSLVYQWEQERIAKNLKIIYKGGEANETLIPLYARLQN